MNVDADILSIFGAFHLDGSNSTVEASVMDIAALAYDYRYALTPDLLAALDKLTPTQRGAAFKRLGSALNKNLSGMDQVSPLYRRFPNHQILPFDVRFLGWLMTHLGFQFDHDPAEFGADPFTGFQNDWLGGDTDLDAEFTLRFKDEDGNRRRKVRFIKLADESFITDKAVAMMSNLEPFSSAETRFMKWALSTGALPTSALASIKFREKLPLVWDMMTNDQYAAACNSVTDVLRLAVHLSGSVRRHKVGKSWTGIHGRTVTQEADLSLKTPPRFRLTTSQAKAVMDILEAVLVRGNTDHETDFLRHAEPWKRLASHVRIRSFEKRAPNAYAALMDLRTGWLKSWESKYAAADVAGKIALAKDRPGVLARRMTELSRLASSKDMSALLSAAKGAFDTVDAGKLLQLRTHLTRTVEHDKRFHMLPNGTIMASDRAPDRIDPRLTHLLDASLHSRLAGKLPFSRDVPEEAFGVFVPAGNRSASDTDVRTSRGDRVKLDFTNDDTVRFFLHWKESCDVDMSAVFYDADLNRQGDCSYMSLRQGNYAVHSGDILNGSRGAAEYIDIDVAKARKAGIRYVLMNANVFSGMTFDTFPCFAGLMIRDGQTGKHFEVSTVETKLSLDSETRNTSPAILDLETGYMVYLDLHGNWGRHNNVRSKAADLKDIMRYFLTYRDYRPSFGDIVSIAGSDDPAAPKATVEAIRDQKDEILAVLADA